MGGLIMVMNFFSYFPLQIITFKSFKNIISILVACIISNASSISYVVVWIVLKGMWFIEGSTWDEEATSFGRWEPIVSIGPIIPKAW